MKPFFIFLRALGIYLLLTLPTMLLPVMYLLSAFYAITFGWIACVFFILCYHVLLRSKMPFQLKWNLLFFAVGAGVAIAHHFIGVLNVQANVWDINPFLGFPIAAALSGWISLFISRKAVKENFDPEEDEITSLLQHE